MHRKLTLSLVTITVLMLGNLVSRAQDSSETVKWHTRYTPAIEDAREANKKLLIVFTASTWVDICKVFEQDILSQEDFHGPISEGYVLLKLEYPRENRMERQIATEYQLLKDAYRVRGFPTVIVTDTEGRPFGMNGYQPVTAAQYSGIMLAMLKGCQVRDQAFAEAGKMKGLEKARKLVEGLPNLPGNLSARYYRSQMEEVIALDPKDETGKTKTYQAQIDDVDYSAEMQRLAADVQYGKMLELTEQFIREQKLEGSRLQKVLLNKVNVQQRQKNTAGVIQTLLEVVEVAPESQYGKMARQQLDQMRAQKIQDQLAR